MNDLRLPRFHRGRTPPTDRIGLWLVAVLCAAAWAAIFGVGYLVGRVVG